MCSVVVEVLTAGRPRRRPLLHCGAQSHSLAHDLGIELGNGPERDEGRVGAGPRLRWCTGSCTAPPAAILPPCRDHLDRLDHSTNPSPILNLLPRLEPTLELLMKTNHGKEVELTKVNNIVNAYIITKVKDFFLFENHLLYCIFHLHKSINTPNMSYLSRVMHCYSNKNLYYDETYFYIQFTKSVKESRIKE